MRYFLIPTLALLAAPALAAHDHGDFLPLTGVWANPPARVAADVADETDCRAHIQKVVCYATGSGGWTRPCLPDSKKYFAAFEALYDRVPPVLQKMFCSLEKLYVEKDLESTAYALQGRPVIGIRASLLDGNLSLAQWATWKEQLNFGGKGTSYATSEALPTYVSKQAPGTNDMVYSIIVHEFGHLFDFANDLNGNLKAGTYGSISWLSYSKPKPANEFPSRKKLCFYHCTGAKLTSAAVTEVYRDLAKTDFLNSYTARNPYEDFADTFSFYFLFREAKVDYSLETRQGDSYDIRDVFESDKLAAKVKYIEDFVDNDEKKYPK